MDKKEIVFTEGLFIKEVKDAETGEIKPDTLSIGIKWLEFCNWATNKKTENGWLNLYICKSKSGKWYAKFNDSQWRASTGTVDSEEEKLPF